VCHKISISLLHTLAVRIFSVLLNTVICKSVSSKSKATSLHTVDNSPYALSYPECEGGGWHGVCFTTELAQNAGGFLKEASSLVSPQAFEKRYGKKQFPLIEEPSGALEIVILKCLSVSAVCLKDAVLLNVHKKYRETGSSGSEVSLSADFDAKLLFLKDHFSPSTRRYRKYLALCKKTDGGPKSFP